jgi:pathogenesis-related protein 1
MFRILFLLGIMISGIGVAAQKLDLKIQVETDKDLWLSAHNGERALYPVEPLKWSRDLEQTSMHWAVELTKECKSLKHSPNRGDIGENLAGSSGRIHPVTLPVKWWVKEKEWFDYDKNECNAPSGRSCGHWRQVVSKRSVYVGCAKAMCKGSGNKVFYVCQYKPHGNMNVGTTRPY